MVIILDLNTIGGGTSIRPAVGDPTLKSKNQRDMDKRRGKKTKR